MSTGKYRTSTTKRYIRITIAGTYGIPFDLVWSIRDIKVFSPCITASDDNFSQINLACPVVPTVELTIERILR